MDNPAVGRPAAGRTVGPSAVAQLLRDRSLRLASALAVAVAIPVAVLFYFQFRSLSDLSRSSNVVLRQLSRETADSITQTIENALKTPFVDVILRIPRGRTEPLDLPFIQEVLDRSLAKSPFITRFYVWTDVGDVHRGEVLVFDRSSRDFRVNPPEAAQLAAKVRELVPRKKAIGAFDTTIEGRRTYVQCQLAFPPLSSRDRPTSFEAFAVDAERLRTDFLPGFIQTNLRAIEEPTGFPALSVSVLDDTGRVIFPPQGTEPRKFVDERQFPLVFFDKELLEYAAPYEAHREVWRLRTGYGNETIPNIIAARERPQRAMMAILAAVMALGVFFVVRAAAREVRL